MEQHRKVYTVKTDKGDEISVQFIYENEAYCQSDLIGPVNGAMLKANANIKYENGKWGWPYFFSIDRLIERDGVWYHSYDPKIKVSDKMRMHVKEMFQAAIIKVIFENKSCQYDAKLYNAERALDTKQTELKVFRESVINLNKEIAEQRDVISKIKAGKQFSQFEK